MRTVTFYYENILCLLESFSPEAVLSTVAVQIGPDPVPAQAGSPHTLDGPAEAVLSTGWSGPNGRTGLLEKMSVAHGW